MKKLLLVLLFSIAFLERTTFDLGPNIELVTATMVLASFYFGRKESFWLTLAVIVVSDFIIGNTSIFIFTWSGFLIPALLSKSLINQLTRLTNQLSPKYKSRLFSTKLFSLTSTGLASNLFFFLWTNLGVWLLDSWGMYTKDLSGLTKCYINAIPFLKNQMMGTLVFIPLIYISIEVSKYFLSRKSTYLLEKTSLIVEASPQESN